MTDPGKYWWVGVERDRQLNVTGWVGETPEGWVPFLLLYPSAHGIAAEMRQLAQVLELRPVDGSDAPAAAHQASAVLAGDQLEIRFPGWSTTIPVNAEFGAAARIGWGVLTLGVDGWDGRHGPGLERYLSRTRRLHYGRILIAQE